VGNRSPFFLSAVFLKIALASIFLFKKENLKIFSYKKIFEGVVLQ